MIFRNSPAINTLEECRRTGASIRHIHSGRLPRTVLSLILLIPLVLPALAQDKESADVSADVPDVSAKSSLTPAAVLYEPSNRRDPFLYIVPDTSAKNVVFKDEEISRGTPPPGIAGTFIDKAKLEGIVIRSGNQRIAVIRGADNKAYFLREGDRLFDGYIQTIESDSVVFVRETFMRSGKTVTTEITKRLRNS
ncbi:MAG: hypothetical protein LBJ21_00010 [Acidobacteriota bacterium]|nr:hypothetical protein [Acidobacteriota bacterium]